MVLFRPIFNFPAAVSLLVPLPLSSWSIHFTARIFLPRCISLRQFHFSPLFAARFIRHFLLFRSFRRFHSASLSGIASPLNISPLIIMPFASATPFRAGLAAFAAPGLASCPAFYFFFAHYRASTGFRAAYSLGRTASAGPPLLPPGSLGQPGAWAVPGFRAGALLPPGFRFFSRFAQAFCRAWAFRILPGFLLVIMAPPASASGSPVIRATAAATGCLVSARFAGPGFSAQAFAAPLPLDYRSSLIPRRGYRASSSPGPARHFRTRAISRRSRFSGKFRFSAPAPHTALPGHVCFHFVSGRCCRAVSF